MHNTRLYAATLHKNPHSYKVAYRAAGFEALQMVKLLENGFNHFDVIANKVTHTMFSVWLVSFPTSKRIRVYFLRICCKDFMGEMSASLFVHRLHRNILVRRTVAVVVVVVAVVDVARCIFLFFSFLFSFIYKFALFPFCVLFKNFNANALRVHKAQ